MDAAEVRARAEAIRRFAEENADELLSQLQGSAKEAGWRVERVASAEEASRYVAALAREVEARAIVRSAHPALERMELERALLGTAVDVELMALEEGASVSSRDEHRRRFRQSAIDASIGVTGVDYAIAETGSCVLLARAGVSRLVSLLPPVHMVVVERGQTLPSLDELFALLREEFQDENLGSYMNLISGPSRSADIEYKLVTGVHGPGEAHMVVVSP